MDLLSSHSSFLIQLFPSSFISPTLRWCLTTEFASLLFGFTLFIFCFFYLFLNKSTNSIKPIMLNYWNTQLHKRTKTPLSSTKFSLILLNTARFLSTSAAKACESGVPAWQISKSDETPPRDPIALAFSFKKVNTWKATQACSFANPLPESKTWSNWFSRLQRRPSLSSPWNSNRAEKIATTLIGWLSSAFMAAKLPHLVF